MSVEYLITGAAGHLGSTILQQLVQEKQTVRALVLPGDACAARLPKEVTLFYGNVTDPASLAEFFGDEKDGVQRVVIHAAGIVTISSKYDARVHAVNVCGTQNIVEQCELHHVKKLVYVSSVHAIPERPRGETCVETNDFDPDKVVGLYAKTKAEATACVLAAAARGLDASVVHPSGICGPNDMAGTGHVVQLLLDYCNGSLMAGLKGGGYDFVDVRDVADGVLRCCEKGARGACYILSNRFFTIQDLLELFHTVTGLRRVRTYLPLWFAKLTAPVAELYYKLLHQPPLYTVYSM
ncbi:MAG: NAD-dependent epimerase/dehydratase family protein, partial [Ruthenibacterium sp.]